MQLCYMAIKLSGRPAVIEMNFFGELIRLTHVLAYEPFYNQKYQMRSLN